MKILQSFGGGGGVGLLDDPINVSIGSISGNDETADVATWDRNSQGGNNGFEEIRIVRVAYNDTGDSILYAFYRTYAYDSLGMLVTVSAVTRVAVDVPELCT